MTDTNQNSPVPPENEEELEPQEPLKDPILEAASPAPIDNLDDLDELIAAFSGRLNKMNKHSEARQEKDGDHLKNVAQQAEDERWTSKTGLPFTEDELKGLVAATMQRGLWLAGSLWTKEQAEAQGIKEEDFEPLKQAVAWEVVSKTVSEAGVSTYNLKPVNVKPEIREQVLCQMEVGPEGTKVTSFEVKRDTVSQPNPKT